MNSQPLRDSLSTGDPLTPSKLLAMVGGWTGVAESVLPPIALSVAFAISRDPVLSVSTAATLAVAFLAFRLFRKQSTAGAVVGLFGVGFAAFLALREGGQTLDYFVPGFFTNATYGLVLLLSIVFRRPLLGYVIGFLSGSKGNSETASAARLAYLLTWIWTGFFALRLLVQVPMYLASNLELLAASRALFGAPAYAGLLALTWILVRPVMSNSS